ncbi:MAG: dicarboxylate/amino acid:cation symporter [Paludibacteraceae bacterium]|nr:dicarboxylate/amino acid:cation symporter [Paludibacteraceae bacterium]
MKKSFTIRPTLDDVSATVQSIQEQLAAWEIKSGEAMTAAMTLEDTLVKLIDLTPKSEHFYITVSKSLKKTTIRVSARGREFVLKATDVMGDSIDDVMDEEFAPEAEATLRDMMLRTQASRINVRYTKGINRIQILVSRDEKEMLYNTMAGVLSGILAGLIIRRTCSAEMVTILANDLFTPLYQLFLRAIQTMVAPLVFFSLAASITEIGDMRSLGRSGAKVLGSYALTALIACVVVFGLDSLIQAGANRSIPLPPLSDAASDASGVSVIKTLVNIIPNNLFGAFVASDMLQIMVLAVAVGAAAGTIGKHSAMVADAISALNSMFGNITSYIIKFLPVAVFGSTGLLALTIEVNGIGTYATWLGQTLSCYGVMYVVYLILILLIAKVNPMHFVRGYAPTWVTAFSTCSSNAAMPFTMAACRRLGVSKRIYSFSIPVGSTVNMDGTVVFYLTTTLFAARLFGVDFDLSTIANLIVTSMLLSMATPGTPGSVLTMFLVIFAAAGVPSEAFSLIMPFVPLVEPFIAATGVTGDGMVSTIVAASENQLDKETYNNI